MGRWLLIAAMLIVVGLGGASAMRSFNDIPRLDEAVKGSWAQVENQYQRRADLIPNLVETVKGAANFERDTLTAVVEARSRVAQMGIPKDLLENPETFRRFEQNQSALSQSLARLLVVVERYPDLKANQNFLALQSQLEGTENRIAVARRDYVETVQRYNVELRTFPGRFWASLFYPDATVRPNFTAQPGSEQAPAVRFDKK